MFLTISAGMVEHYNKASYTTKSERLKGLGRLDAFEISRT
jgi:hypothetical protein